MKMNPLVRRVVAWLMITGLAASGQTVAGPVDTDPRYKVTYFQTEQGKVQRRTGHLEFGAQEILLRDSKSDQIVKVFRRDQPLAVRYSHATKPELPQMEDVRWSAATSSPDLTGPVFRSHEEIKYTVILIAVIAAAIVGVILLIRAANKFSPFAQRKHHWLMLANSDDAVLLSLQARDVQPALRLLQ